jgi:hypothetical protein
MKGLASFVMRGRFQALLVTIASSGSLLFCWIGAAVVALVTLRKGLGPGAWLLMWGLLPAGALAYIAGDTGPLALLLGTALLAGVLRTTVSLPMAVLASVVVGGLTGLGVMAFAGAYLDQVVSYFGEFLAGLEQQLSQGGEQVVLARPDATQVAGMMGAGSAMMAVICLLLGRYWQAALYNPGGFGTEFRALYYPPAVAAVLALLAIALASLGAAYRTWALICLIPLSFAGLALVHARVAHRGQGTGWLVGFYVAWLFFDPVKLLVLFAAIADSWMNFRQKWAADKGTEVSRGDDARRDDARRDDDE